jgi:GAF domain-containing protein
MLTGRRAFNGDTVSDTLAAVLRADLDWASLPPDTPLFVRRLLRRCLDKDPSRRLQHIGDARLELDQSAFERLVTDISARFVNAQPAQVDAEITDALRSLVEFLGVDRSTLFQLSADGRNLKNTHHWVVEGCQPLPPLLAHDTFPYFFRKFLQGRPYSWASLSELPPEAAVDRAFLEKHGPKSNLSFPLVVGGSIVGGLAFGMLRRECQWPDALTERLSVVAHVFANALERKRSDLALQRAYTEVTQIKERLELENQYLRQELANRREKRRNRRADDRDEARVPQDPTRRRD